MDTDDDAPATAPVDATGADPEEVEQAESDLPEVVGQIADSEHFAWTQLHQEEDQKEGQLPCPSDHLE